MKQQRPEQEQEADEYADILESARNPREVVEQPPLVTQQTLRVAMTCSKVAAEREEYLPRLEELEKHGQR